VGYADLRKGFDLFMRVVARLAASEEALTFVWLGCEMPMLRHWARHDAERLGFSERLHLLPRLEEVHAYYAASDLLLLPSREDPFPSVVLEALSQAVPVVAFDGATGAVDLLRKGCGSTVPYGDDEAMFEEALRLLRDDDARERMGHRGRALVAEELDWRDYVYDLLGRVGEHRHRVSVVVPNYNYSRHLRQRLESIFAQSYAVYEVIVIDDRSTDDSVEVVKRLQAERNWDLQLVTAEVNSGSVVEQWRRGVELARGELIWIAEADDWAEPEFLTTLAVHLDDPEVILAYSQSRQVDEHGHVLAPHYLDYVKDVDDVKWRRSWVREGRDELREALVVKNTIPNVSATLLRREPLRRVLQDDMDFVRGFRRAGDYACYIRLLAGGGKIAFASEVLNNHRRHEQSVTLQGFGVGLAAEIARLQTEVYDSVGATPEAAAKAERYMGTLSRQFQLVPDDQHWGRRPELSELARHPLYVSSGGTVRSQETV
jgi:GT2 family glycosyltransferase